MSPRELPQRIVIPHEDLSPQIQEGVQLIKRARNFRAFNDGIFVVMTLFNAWIAHRTGVIPFNAPLPLGISGTFRTLQAKHIQRAHRKLPLDKGVIIPSRERTHPKNWINASTIAQTHPIFYVNGKGDVVFLRPTRAEYYRYRYQQSFAGRWGLNMWKWRGYLSPIKAPESWKKWAAKQLERVREQVQPIPLPAPSRVRVHARPASIRRPNVRRMNRR